MLGPLLILGNLWSFCCPDVISSPCDKSVQYICRWKCRQCKSNGAEGEKPCNVTVVLGVGVNFNARWLGWSCPWSCLKLSCHRIIRDPVNRCCWHQYLTFIIVNILALCIVTGEVLCIYCHYYPTKPQLSRVNLSFMCIELLPLILLVRPLLTGPVSTCAPP